MKKLFTLFFTILSLSQLMADDIVWTFPPTTLSTATVNSSDPQIAIDANGDLVAAWVENGFIKASTKTVSGSWVAPVTLSATGASSPRITADLSGNAAAIWLEGGVVKGATKPFAGSWTSSTTLSSTTATSPSLAVDAAGDVVAVWARGANIESSTKLFGAAWQAKVQITSAAAAAPHVAIGGSGANTRAVVVWQGTSSGANVVFASSKLISGSWSAQQVISDINHSAGYAHVALDASANATAVWYEYNLTGSIYSQVTAQAATRDAATGVWSPAVAISSPGAFNPANLVARVSYDANGNAIAIWNNSFDGATFTIQSAVKPVREDWSTPVEVVNNLYAYEVDLAVSSLGDAIASYMFYNGSSLLVQSTEINFSGFLENAWAVPINLSSGTNNGFPRLAATLTGNVINAAAVWINSNSHTTIQAATGTKAVVLPPSGLSVTQSVNNFGVFNEYYNTLSWTASTDPDLVGYAIFRNGVFFETVGATVVSIVDHNKAQNGPVTYGVAAINSQNSQSRVVNVSFP
ncbi:MAG: hypothetical protein HYX48_00320 [Chlamydiales bacterium]|nr:hypothetical protein [Chlamydiales bacterium]